MGLQPLLCLLGKLVSPLMSLLLYRVTAHTRLIGPQTRCEFCTVLSPLREGVVIRNFEKKKTCEVPRSCLHVTSLPSPPGEGGVVEFCIAKFSMQWYFAFHLCSSLRFSKSKKPAVLIPFLPLTFIVAYQADYVYGTKMSRIRGK